MSPELQRQKEILKDPKTLIGAIFEAGQKVHHLWLEIVSLQEDPSLGKSLPLTFSAINRPFRIVVSDFIAISEETTKNVSCPCLVLRREEGQSVTLTQGTIKNGRLRGKEDGLQIKDLDHLDLRILNEALQALNSARNEGEENLIVSKAQSIEVRDLRKKIACGQSTDFDNLARGEGRNLLGTIIAEESPFSLQERVGLLIKLGDAERARRFIRESDFFLVVPWVTAVVMMWSRLSDLRQEPEKIMTNLGLFLSVETGLTFMLSAIISTLNNRFRKRLAQNLTMVRKATVESSIKTSTTPSSIPTISSV